MNPVERFIMEHEGEQQKIMAYLHDLLMSNPGVICKIRYRVPFYYQNSWFCYFNPQADGSVEFSFIRGNELSNRQGILDAKGRKQVSSINCKKLRNIPEKAIIEIIQEALILDDTVPYTHPRKRNTK